MSTNSPLIAASTSGPRPAALGSGNSRSTVIAQRRQPVAQHTFNDADLILQAVLDGLGIAQLPAYQVCDLLGDGQLVRCLAQHAPDDGGHYICYLSRKHLPARIRVFVDYMTEHTRALDLQCLTTMPTSIDSRMTTAGTVLHRLMRLRATRCVPPRPYRMT